MSIENIKNHVERLTILKKQFSADTVRKEKYTNELESFKDRPIVYTAMEEDIKQITNTISTYHDELTRLQHYHDILEYLEMLKEDALAYISSNDKSIIFLERTLLDIKSGVFEIEKLMPMFRPQKSTGTVIEELTQSVGHNDDTIQIVGPTKKFRGWVKQLILIKPESEALLRNAGIWDDESYYENECSVETDGRVILALERYCAVTGSVVSRTNILDNLRACPNWFLDYQLNAINLTVRMHNVCVSHNMTTIRDLMSRGRNGLLKLPHMGQGSVHRLGILLWEHFIGGEALRSKKRGSYGDDKVCITEDMYVEKSVGLHTPLLFAHVMDGFLDVYRGLPERDRGIWAARIGFRCIPQTLQFIATQACLTRERVRQIEITSYKKIQNHYFWIALTEHLNNHLDNRNSPLLLNVLPTIDPWFKGVEELKEPLREVFNHILQDRFSILDINDTTVITRMRSTEWAAVVDAGKTLLREMVHDKVSESDVRAQIEALINGPGEELRDELWTTIQAVAIWAEKSEGELILVGYGRTAEATVTAILESAGHPLHYNEIYQRSKTFSDKNYKWRALHHAASNVAFLYNRGTYGLLSHCPLSSKELSLIESEVEDIAAGQDPAKQWHASEFLDMLLERGFDFNGQLNKYIVNIALRNSTTFISMRRMLWGYKERWPASAASRIDIRQAMVTILEEEGGPLNTLELRKKLEAQRGLNKYFQLHPQGNLVRLSGGLWGLANRDIKASKIS